MRYLLDAEYQADWIVVSFPIIRIVLMLIMLACAIGLIIAVLMQSENSGGGTNAITGVQESYYAKNKGATKDGRLKKWTVIFSVVIAVCIILYFVSLMINNPV